MALGTLTLLVRHLKNRLTPEQREFFKCDYSELKEIPKDIRNLIIEVGLKEKSPTKLRIIELCKNQNITINKLATISGITQSTLNNITGGRNNSTTISTIKKLCDGLNIDIKEFFNSNLFYDLDQEIK